MGGVVIVMAYHDREMQLTRTIATMNQSAYGDWHAVVVDDASREPISASWDNVDVIRIEPEDKLWHNGEPAYNTGIRYGIREYNPDVIILQNPECYHVGDVISYAAANVTAANYLSFAAFSLDENNTKKNHNINAIMAGHNSNVKCDFDNGWYNHSTHRPVGYDFCAAIHTGNIMMLNGYDERFSSGLAFGDNYLLHRVKAMGLTLQIVDNPFVVHQWHTRNLPGNARELINRNAALWRSLSQTKEIRAKHIYTPDI